MNGLHRCRDFCHSRPGAMSAGASSPWLRTAVTITARSFIAGKGEILAPDTLEVEDGKFTAARSTRLRSNGWCS